MRRMPRSRLAPCRTACVVVWLVTGCISDPAVEADVPASPGVVQPEAAAGDPVAVVGACQRIKDARAAAAKRLGCDDPGDECPGYLDLAGARPCELYAGGSLDACEAVFEKYASCADFSAHPCVVTPIAQSCHPAPPPAAMDAGDSG